MKKNWCKWLPWLPIILFSGCLSKPSEEVLFEALDHNRTGLHFSNILTSTPQFNMFRYMYFYNGAGVGCGDFNNDGRTDLFFASNQQQNKLYLNEGDLHFRDATNEARIPNDGSWSTGVSIADINNDGWLDIYICQVSGFENLKGKNQLLICQGIDKNGNPFYAEKAAEYGLDFAGFSTQAAFFDYDLDGDLDVFLLNHSVHQNGTFGKRDLFTGTHHPLSGDRIYRNNGQSFEDVTKSAGIQSSAIGYGLGIAISDINLDGYPDIYVGNDFHENDYLYINQKNGTFREELTTSMEHTSQFSMGVDVADINNDAYPEVISVDMLPSDPYVLKRSLGEDEYNVFHMKIGYGYHPQYAKNALQLNGGNGKFRDIAMYSGVFATDWSWAPLWMDFDNDGLKDLFVSNGIPKRLNDIDYVNYVTDEKVQAKIRTNAVDEKEMAVINDFPEIKLANKFFRNGGDAMFKDMSRHIGNDRETFSNGSVYADFDNDGDLDVVVNNIADPALLYANRTNDKKEKTFLDITLNGPGENRRALGAKVIVFAGGERHTYEKFPAKGFQSSMEIPVHLGLFGVKVDSILLIWPDNSYQPVPWDSTRKRIDITYRKGLPQFDYTALHAQQKSIVTEDITPGSGLDFLHEENPFVEFDREPLIPFMVSRDGPALAVADINNDGLDDVFIGSSKGKKSALFLQGATGKFIKSVQPSLDADSVWEDVDACWVDVNNDKHPDLVVASGGNEYYGKDEHLLPRVYINDGASNFTRLPDAFAGIYLTASCVAAQDFNGDGYADLFIGGRAVPWEYGATPRSCLLINDKTGRFKDVAGSELAGAGFVKHAVWEDLDKDRSADLLLSLEWGGITAFLNKNGRFVKKELTGKKGWWNFALPCDVDKDGDIDLIAGNTGLNNRLKPTKEKPVKLYYNDFDGNEKGEQVLTYYLEGRQIPFANKAELEKQIPLLKKKFLYADDFARASLADIFSGGKLKSSLVWESDYFSNSVLINDGHLNFTLAALPWRAQLTSYKDAAMVDANGDSLPDILLVGNFYENNIQMGRYDGDRGMLLINKGGGKFDCMSLDIEGQGRKVRNLKTPNGAAFIVARNNDSLKLMRFTKPANKSL
jgi:hypothetical protein